MSSGSGVHLLVSGCVQGVGFRFYARRQALALALNGYVRNLPDGKVEAVAVGPRSGVESFVAQLQRGPAGSGVQECVVTWLDTPAQYAGFTIR